MTPTTHQGRVALEWFNASGERTRGRLRSLTDHFCHSGAIEDVETRAAIYRDAEMCARFEEDGQ